MQAQFQEFKYGWLACIDNEKQLVEKATTISTNSVFFLKTYWRRVSGTSLPIIKSCLIVKQFLY